MFNWNSVKNKNFEVTMKRSIILVVSCPKSNYETQVVWKGKYKSECVTYDTSSRDSE